MEMESEEIKSNLEVKWYKCLNLFLLYKSYSSLVGESSLRREGAALVAFIFLPGIYKMHPQQTAPRALAFLWISVSWSLQGDPVAYLFVIH